MMPEQLGPYKIVGTLGRGGMGAVYRGIHVETDESAAVKVLATDLAAEEGFRQRFEAEIETLRKLYHPNIVQLFGFGEQDGLLFYSMELVEGCSLEEELRRGRKFDWRETARIAIQTCRALRHAHDRGIVHRDIKPANLLLTTEGRVKLSDFGIARLFGYTRITAVGNVLGTVEYMAPEQADGKPAGPKADLYSLGGVLFALLARRPPFRARSLPEMLDKQRTAIPDPIRTYAPETPEEFEQIISQLLEKDPDKRVSNPILLSRRLESMLHALSIRPTAAERGRLDVLPSGPVGPVGAAPVEAGATRISDSQPLGTPSREAVNDCPPTLATPAPPAESTPGLAPTKYDPGYKLEAAEHSRSAADGPGQTEIHRTVDQPATKAAEEPPAGVSSQEEPAETREAADPYAVPPSRPAAQPTQVGATQSGQGKFVAVREDDLDRHETGEPERPLISLQTWALAAALVCIGLTAYYFLRPPTADVLYQRIVRKTGDRNIESLIASEDDISNFLLMYPNDPRRGQLAEYHREIELYRLERRLELRSKGRAGADLMLPIERTYVRAMSTAQSDPEQAATRLEALVDLYRDHGEASGPTGECLELARRQLGRLKKQVDGLRIDTLTELDSRLQRAEELRATEPELARAILNGIVALYQDAPWAADQVRRARQGLSALEPKK